MIIVNLQGGLGNQLFQYAAGLRLAQDRKIYFDLSFLRKNNVSNAHFQARNFELSIFKNINYGIVNPLLWRIYTSNHILARMFKKLLSLGFGRLELVNEENIATKFKSRESLYLYGYFQNPRIFEDIRPKLLENLKFPALDAKFKKMEDQIRSTTSVSLHIRRGDYLNPETLEYHGVLPIEYYQAAVAEISEKVTDPHYFIFSDDVEWCKGALNFLTKKTIVSALNTPNWVDLYLMSICDHHIIANSSFSWWGAWLNTNADKIVVAPKKWFVNNDTEILPAGWLTIS